MEHFKYVAYSPEINVLIFWFPGCRKGEYKMARSVRPVTDKEVKKKCGDADTTVTLSNGEGGAMNVVVLLV